MITVEDVSWPLGLTTGREEEIGNYDLETRRGMEPNEVTLGWVW